MEIVSYFDKFGILVLEKQDLLFHLLDLGLRRHLLQLQFLASPLLLVQLLLQVLGEKYTGSVSTLSLRDSTHANKQGQNEMPILDFQNGRVIFKNIKCNYVKQTLVSTIG